MAEPNHPFIARLLEEMPRRFRKSDWAYHAVVLPYEMARTHRDLIHVEPVESFIPFDFRTDDLFRSAEEADLDALFARTLNRSYCIHLWETIWRKPFLNRIDENYLASENTLFAHLFRGYLFHLQSQPASTRTNADLRR